MIRALIFLFTLIASAAYPRGSVTHPVAHLEVLPPPTWMVSYCTITGPAAAYAWATPTDGKICNFSYLNYAGTYTITVYEEAPLRGAITQEELTINPLLPGQSAPNIVIQMEVEP